MCFVFRRKAGCCVLCVQEKDCWLLCVQEKGFCPGHKADDSRSSGGSNDNDDQY